MTLSKDQILAADDLRVEEVDVPEWGGTVRVRSLTGTERDAYEASIVQIQGNSRRLRMENARAKLVALCLVDEDGGRLFSDQEIGTLGSKSGKVLDRLFDVASKLSGLSNDDVEELTETFS